MKYRVVSIVSDPELLKSYTRAANAEFPQLAEYVEDEYEIFVIAEDGAFWYARDFFYMNGIQSFEGDA